MKKFVFTLTMFAFSLSVQGQVTQLPKGFTSGKTVWFLRAGVSLNGVSGDGVDAVEEIWKKNKWDGSYGRSLGGSLSIGFNKSFSKSPLYWGMEFGVGIRGYKNSADWYALETSSLKGGGDMEHTKKQEQTLNAINALFSPINIGYKYAFSNRMAVDIHVGGFASYDFIGKLKTENYDHVYINSKAGYTNKITNDDSSIDISDLDGYTNHDFGVIGGIGFWFGRFNIDFCYQRGFVSLFEGDDSFFCDKLQARLGYAF